MPEKVLRGFQVNLRPPRPEDSEEWLGVRRRNKRFLQPFEPLWGQDVFTPEYFARRLKRQTRDWHADRAYCFLIFKREDDSLIGGINVLNVWRGAAQQAKLGYWLDEAHQGQGYMRASMRLIAHFARNELKLHRLNAAALPHNTRSINTLKKIGFEEEGRARSYFEINGEWQDHVLFGLILEEFIDKEKEA